MVSTSRRVCGLRLRAAVLLAAAALSLLSPSSALAQRTDRVWLEALADAAARRVGLDPILVRAIVTVESAWRPRAVSSKGAIGLMQILRTTAGDYATNVDLFDPASNLAVGVVHLRRLVDAYGVVGALAAWNAGEGAYEGGRVLAAYGETRRFVARVIIEVERLSAAAR